SRMMAGIKGANTKPEMMLRRALHARGFRYRIHDKRLPGKPDIVLPNWRVVIEVRGCFWHRHQGCSKAAIPATNPDFWQDKFSANVLRDETNAKALVADGWRVLIVWECAMTRRLPEHVLEQVTAFVMDGAHHEIRYREIGDAGKNP
ncbi:MAG: very short patch repair endonuclease, partial [Pseudomonadota bacterium]|nr:very short patch repair endonuclease [Pseudomonadota bacterium]